MSSTDDGWYVIKDIEQFINSTRILVFNTFGDIKQNDSIYEITSEEEGELNKILSYEESEVLLKEYVKQQKNKKTNDIRYIISDIQFSKFIDSLNSRMISNMLNNLVNKGVLDSGFDDESNDFIFWIKDNPDEKFKAN
jgi:hypothetical protein